MRFEEAGAYIMNKLEQELPEHLSYHSAEHVADVYEAAERIGRAEVISESDMKLLLTAAWYHDSGFLRGPKDHEEESCRIARATLPDFGYEAEAIETICGMIMATRIPQTPHNLLEQIIADADLDYLGRDDFFSIGEKLFTELVAFDVLNTEEEWNNLQVRFLEGHHYFTKTAIDTRQAEKEKHLGMVREKLRRG